MNHPELDWEQPWQSAAWQERTHWLQDSFRRWLKRDLIPPEVASQDSARWLYQAPFVVVAHGTQTDPLFIYGNQTALRLWEIDLPTLLQTPSKHTAEPMHRDERSQLLERTRRDGYVDDYKGIRISTTGQRFRIDPAIVWNLVDENDNYVGQAATFDDWTLL